MFSLPDGSRLFAGLAVALAGCLTPARSPAQTPAVTVLVVYYSVTGNTQKLAAAVAQGAQKTPGTTVLTKNVSEASLADLKAADAIVLGSPTYFGDMAAPMKAFIDDWHLKHKVSLVDKVGGAFSAGSDETGGKEHVIYSLNLAMMNAGMVIVGPVHDRYGMAGVSAREPVDEAALEYARSLGGRVAAMARRLKIGDSPEGAR